MLRHFLICKIVVTYLYGTISCLQVYCEGIHILIPWIERPIIYDVRAQPHLVEITSGSRDLHMVNFFPLILNI